MEEIKEDKILGIIDDFFDPLIISFSYRHISVIRG
jgi:hypothetical protein